MPALAVGDAIIHADPVRLLRLDQIASLIEKAAAARRRDFIQGLSQSPSQIFQWRASSRLGLSIGHEAILAVHYVE